MFDRRKGEYFQIKKLSVLIKRICVYGCIFSFLRNSMLLDLKNEKHIAC